MLTFIVSLVLVVFLTIGTVQVAIALVVIYEGLTEYYQGRKYHE